MQRRQETGELRRAGSQWMETRVSLSSSSSHKYEPNVQVFLLHDHQLSACVFIQVSARPSCPRRNGTRGGKSWRRNGRSAKLLKVLSNWAHASWTDWARKERFEGGNGDGRNMEHSNLDPEQQAEARHSTKEQKDMLAVDKML